MAFEVKCKIMGMTIEAFMEVASTNNGRDRIPNKSTIDIIGE